jgi:hypothetical protein
MSTEELEDKFDKAFDKNTSPTGGSYEADYTYRQGLWNDFLPSIIEFAKAYHIAQVEATKEAQKTSTIN